MNRPADLPISRADWQRTPLSVQALVMSLWERGKRLEQVVAEQAAPLSRMAALEEEVARLREQVGKSSRNSSRPPSSDPPSVAKRRRRSSGRSRGGQPGHEGHGRSLRSRDEVNEIVPVKPATCGSCGHPLQGEDVHPQRHQVVEIPPVQAQVTEYELHTLRCTHCGLLTEAPWPVGVPRGAFGPRIQALVGLLSGSYRLSKRLIEELLADAFGVKLSLGTVCGLEQQVSRAVAAPVAEACRQVQHQEAANLDETGWREGGVRAWLWTAVTAWVTVFVIRAHRSQAVVRELLGHDFAGTVGSDRYSAYSYLPVGGRQVCWAHLRRDFQAMVDRGGVSASIGQPLLDQAQTMFTWWHRVRDGTLERSTFRSYMSRVRHRVHMDLWYGTLCSHEATAATCREIRKVESALWTFVRCEGVEPTNNAAERALRHGVLWRKGSFGTDSPDGSRFVEHLMTVRATLRQQQRNMLEYLTAACEAALHQRRPPSLLPASTSTPA